jgi:hypothetical protein
MFPKAPRGPNWGQAVVSTFVRAGGFHERREGQQTLPQTLKIECPLVHLVYTSQYQEHF